MRHWILTTIVAIAVLSVGVRLSSQSLADVARAERARRQAIKTPAKLYTNESLPAEPAASGPAGLSATATPPAPGPSPEPSKETVSKDESFWRQRIGSERTALARARILADALQ